MVFPTRARPLNRQPAPAVSAASSPYASPKRGATPQTIAEPSNVANQNTSWLSGRIRRNDLVYMTSQLSIMIETGIPLSKALENLAAQEENQALVNLLNDLKDRVVGGADFSTALAHHGNHFDATFISLVRAGEATGNLGEMLERIAQYMRSDYETRGKIKAALAYPCVMMVVASAVTLFLLIYIMPKFTPIFASRGMSLPLPTKILLTTSSWLVTYWYAWLSGVLVVVAGIVYLQINETGRQIRDQFLIKLPLVGSLIRKATVNRAIRTLATLVECGVSMVDSLQLTAEVSANRIYRAAWLRVLGDVTQGKRISESLKTDRLFPNTLVQMIASGEETGKLDSVLKRVSLFYDRELDLAIKTQTSLIEPIMIIVMGFVVGGIAMSLMLPIFQLSRPAGH